MTNEVSAYQCILRIPYQIGNTLNKKTQQNIRYQTFKSLIQKKENKRSFPQRIKSVIHPNLTMQNMVGHKMRFLVGEVNGKNECFHYSVKEGTWLSTPISCRLIDLQISKATKGNQKKQTKRKSEKTDNEEIVLSSDQSSDFKSNKKGTAKRRTTLFLSYISIGSTS